MKVLIISGSPRNGNTEFVLKSVYDSLNINKEIILLRELNIKRCSGCLYCDEHKKCSIKDDMQNIYSKIEEADIIILGSPNYFDNVSGLMKDFMDRTNPFYETDKLEGKSVYAVVVGGGKLKNHERVAGFIKLFSEAHKMKYIGCKCFKALKYDELKNKNIENEIKEIISEIK
jgi:multimeric flavodoxin WrbA